MIPFWVKLPEEKREGKDEKRTVFPVKLKLQGIVWIEILKKRILKKSPH